MGVVGLSYNDFCLLDVDEFSAICKAFEERQQLMEQQQWERTRLSATICIQPHVKNKLSPQKLLPFPWDGKVPRHEDSKAPHLTHEQRQKRVDELEAKLKGF